jgi:hypothetical protein
MMNTFGRAQAALPTGQDHDPHGTFAQPGKQEKRRLLFRACLAPHFASQRSRVSDKLVNVGLAAIVLMATISGKATTVVGPWVPKFKGVDYSVSTNIPSGDEFPSFHVVHALRVHLTDPDIRLHTTPRIDDYVAGAREAGGRTVSDYLKTYGLQAAVNANFFGPGDYYLPAGTPMDIYGLAVSEGTVVSTQDGPRFAASLIFDAQNHPTALHTNWPAASLENIYTAISGEYSLVVDGKNVAYDLPRGAFIHRQNPRTAIGISQDGSFLYLVAIDGRQPGYSEGAYDYETAGWMLLLGAHDAINLDGGGSTTLVVQDSTGVPLRLNRSSAVADSGRERTLGSHLGVFAKPLPGFINDVAAVAQDTTAKITWTTIEPAISQVDYGPTTDFGNSSAPELQRLSSHEVELSGLTPDTGYYYKIIASTEAQQHVSPTYYFVTTNYVTTNRIFEVTQPWRFTAANGSAGDWTSPNYDDSAWSGPGPGLLWVDVNPLGPNPNVAPKNTEMPVSENGYPFVTYYFRSRFTLPRLPQGGSLRFSGYVDDGAIFYLNGMPIHRLRMPEPADAETLAASFPCEGNATCMDEFFVPIAQLSQLVPGENVLAVEVHNYNVRSGDITFGTALDLIEPAARSARIEIKSSGTGITLIWDAAGFVLQSTETAEGPWTDVTSGAASPFVITPSNAGQYYRLRKQ